MKTANKASQKKIKLVVKVLKDKNLPSCECYGASHHTRKP